MKYLALCIALASLAGCASDQRKDVAYSLLYKPDGFEYDKAFAAAVEARFPQGTQVSELERFAKGLRSECQRRTGKIRCEIVTRSQFCAARWLQIDSDVADDHLLSVRAVTTGAGC